MPLFVYIILAVVVLAVIVFFATRKPSAPALPAQQPSKKPEIAPSVTREKQSETSSSARSLPRPEQETSARQSLDETPLSEAPVTPKVDLSQTIEKSAKFEDTFGARSTFDPNIVRTGLARTRGGMIARLADLIRGRKEIDPTLLQEIESVLLTSDVGVQTTQILIERLQEKLKSKELSDEQKVWAALRAEALRILGQSVPLKIRTKPTVVMMVGVNGSGKTTTIGKLASKLKAQGKSVLLGAGDTFRAAAVRQLEVWAEREHATVVKGKENADPSSVLFDAVSKAKESNIDVVLCDTAGRLHTKINLMDELSKVKRIIAKAMDGAPHETLLVLDATNGQNAIEQAKQFCEVIDVTGIVLTKLDGTAKGGVILAIANELKLPVRFIGIGERSADLREFNAEEFVEALFASSDSLSTEAA